MLLVNVSFSEMPSDLPGEEITQEYIRSMLPIKDTAQTTKPADLSPSWIARISKTWDSPDLSEQIAADETNIPLGKGAIFIPRMGNTHSEPDIEIRSVNGKSIAKGDPGRSFSVEPGDYYVMLGSGSHRQRISRRVTVAEGRIYPVIPDWCGLIVETIDENSKPFRGEYELVRIDEFESFGREYGADPELGETVKTWVLKPGIYKILGRGESYNSLTNFITVRLIAGELTRVLLVQNSTDPDLKIIGGGTVDISPSNEIASNWKYGADIGGTINFAAQNDRTLEVKNKSRITSASFIGSFKVTYMKDPVEWENRIRFEEGFTFLNSDFNDLTKDPDDFYLSSVFIWRFLPWLGPYGSGDLYTNLLPKFVNISDQGTQDHFYLLERDSLVRNSKIDSSRGILLEPSFTPLILTAGVGANVDLASFRYFSSKLRGGFASTWTSYPDHYKIVNESYIKYADSIEFQQDSIRRNGALFLQKINRSDLLELGPQVSSYANVRLGRFAVANFDISLFAPLYPKNRLSRPDINFSSTLSWSLTRGVNLDYNFKYQLKRPQKVDARQDLSTHSVWLRFNYASR